METQALQAKIRKDSGSIKSRRNRKAGLIPAVLYGHKQESIMLSLDKKEFTKVIDARTKMVNLKMDNSEETKLETKQMISHDIKRRKNKRKSKTQHLKEKNTTNKVKINKKQKNGK